MVQAGSVVGFGAFGLAVVAERVEAGELVVEVESAGGQAVSCGVCGVRARSKGRRMVVLRDAPAAGGMPVRVLWGQACLGVPRQRVRGQDLDRAVGPGRCAPGADRKGC